jgi:carboxyl-terminal processing protease
MNAHGRNSSAIRIVYSCFLAVLGLVPAAGAMFLTAASGGCASAPNAGSVPKAEIPATPVEPALTAEERELELLSFDFAWNTIRQKHWDLALGGLNWQAVKDSLRPKVEAAATRTQSRAAMQAMIATLGQSHFGIIPVSVYGEMAGGDGEGQPGFELRILDGRAIVAFIDPHAPAYAQGVRPGWELLRVRTTDIPAKVAAITPAFEGKTTRDLLVTMALTRQMRGAVGDTLSMRFRDGADREVDLQLPLIRPPGNRTVFGNLPPVFASTESKRLGGGAGYIKINIFLDPGSVMAAAGEAIQSFREAPGIILDLRGNPGGLGAMAMGMAGWFIPDQGKKLGTMIMRGNQLRFTVSPRPNPYAGKVAILVDALSASTTEILAAGLQDLGRARIFGTRTAGAALPSIIEQLPNGDGFQYAIANYLSEGGDTLEGNGVVPDSTVALTRETLLAGHDAQLDAATAWIATGR